MELTDFSKTQWLKSFPVESCDMACWLLGLYLYEHGFRGFWIMVGNRPNGAEEKHQWLEDGNVVVDITADQFHGENLPAVIVATESPWHQAREGSRDECVDDEFIRKMMDDKMHDFTRMSYKSVLDTMRNPAWA